MGTPGAMGYGPRPQYQMTNGLDGDETDPSTPDSVVDAAETLIGTESLWRGQILYTGVEVGLLDGLIDGPREASELAEALDLDPDRTYRLLRALAYFGVVDEADLRRFSLTSVGEVFTSAHPQSVQRDLRFNWHPAWVRSMLHLPAVVEEAGPSGFVREFGRGFFEYTTEHPDFGNRYNELMELASSDHPEQVLAAMEGYDWSRFSCVCAVGGGRGHLLCYLVNAVPGLRGIVLDRPEVVADGAARWAHELGVTDRVMYEGGDMFECVPEVDAYVLKWILHNWDDAACHDILSTVHRDAPPDGRLFVIESLVPGPDTDHPSKRLDVTMMAQVGGRERTKAEYGTLLAEAGWDLVETRALDGASVSILEAVKA